MAADSSNHARLIDSLAEALRPVVPLPAPWRRAAAWMVLLAVAAILLAVLGDVAALRRRIELAPDVGWAMLGSAVTAVLAAVAAFQSSVPGRPARWNLLPLPGLVLWVASSGLGCLEGSAEELGQPATLRTAVRECLPFLLLASLPLLALLLFMLRRGFPASPARTAALAGLAAAAGAATLLNFVHPFDVAAIDLLVHGVVVAGIVVTSRSLGPRLLGG
jgi:hypothetical protein